MNYKYNEELCKAFGANLRKHRLAQGLSMRKLAIMADMEYSQLSKIERGVINTTISTVYHLANVLKIDIAKLFDFSK